MSTQPDSTQVRTGPPPVAWLAWAWVVIPFLYGVYKLIERIPALFGG